MLARFRNQIVALSILLSFATAALGQTATPTLSSADPVGAATQIVAQLETIGSVPIVLLDRTSDDGSDPSVFWAAAITKLCAKTGDNWCDTDIQNVLTDTTNLIGWSRIINYNINGVSKTVCAVLPPKPGISPGYVASAIAGGTTYSWQDLPTSDEADAFLLMNHAAHCLDRLGDDQESRRADAFAALNLTLIEGNTAFVSARDITPARKFAAYRYTTSTNWAVSVGERILLELWKSQTAALLRSQANCNATVVTSTNINTAAITRDETIPTDQSCSAPAFVGNVTDANLWLWMDPQSLSVYWPTVQSPPQPYVPFMSFQSLSAAITYTWSTADSIATQTQ